MRDPESNSFFCTNIPLILNLKNLAILFIPRWFSFYDNTGVIMKTVTYSQPKTLLNSHLKLDCLLDPNFLIFCLNVDLINIYPRENVSSIVKYDVTKDPQLAEENCSLSWVGEHFSKAQQPALPPSICPVTGSPRHQQSPNQRKDKDLIRAN